MVELPGGVAVVQLHQAQVARRAAKAAAQRLLGLGAGGIVGPRQPRGHGGPVVRAGGALAAGRAALGIGVPLLQRLPAQAAQQLALQRQQARRAVLPGVVAGEGGAVGGGQQHLVGVVGAVFAPHLVGFSRVLVRRCAAQRTAQPQPQPGVVQRRPVARRRGQPGGQQLALRGQVHGAAAQGQRALDGLQLAKGGFVLAGQAQAQVGLDVAVGPILHVHTQHAEVVQRHGMLRADAQQHGQLALHQRAQRRHHVAGTLRALAGLGHAQLVQAVQHHAGAQAAFAGPAAAAGQQRQQLGRAGRVQPVAQPAGQGCLVKLGSQRVELQVHRQFVGRRAAHVGGRGLKAAGPALQQSACRTLQVVAQQRALAGAGFAAQQVAVLRQRVVQRLQHAVQAGVGAGAVQQQWLLRAQAVGLDVERRLQKVKRHEALVQAFMHGAAALCPAAQQVLPQGAGGLLGHRFQQARGQGGRGLSGHHQQIPQLLLGGGQQVGLAGQISHGVLQVGIPQQRQLAGLGRGGARGQRLQRADAECQRRVARGVGGQCAGQWQQGLALGHHAAYRQQVKARAQRGAEGAAGQVARLQCQQELPPVRRRGPAQQPQGAQRQAGAGRGAFQRVQRLAIGAPQVPGDGGVVQRQALVGQQLGQQLRAQAGQGLVPGGAHAQQQCAGGRRHQAQAGAGLGHQAQRELGRHALLAGLVQQADGQRAGRARRPGRQPAMPGRARGGVAGQWVGMRTAA